MTRDTKKAAKRFARQAKRQKVEATITRIREEGGDVVAYAAKTKYGFEFLTKAEREGYEEARKGYEEARKARANRRRHEKARKARADQRKSTLDEELSRLDGFVVDALKDGRDQDARRILKQGERELRNLEYSGQKKKPRKKLAERDGARFRVTAKVKRFGTKTGFEGRIEPTILLTDLHDAETGEHLTDHLWFTRGKSWQPVKEGDCVAFDARVDSYVKGYQGQRWDVDRTRQIDYKLTRPTKIEVLAV